MEEFKNNLFNKVEMTTENTRWKSEKLPRRFGSLEYCMDRFDANFFSYAPRQANQTDPQIRLLLEVTFEAMLDAGKALFNCYIGATSGYLKAFRY